MPCSSLVDQSVVIFPHSTDDVVSALAWTPADEFCSVHCRLTCRWHHSLWRSPAAVRRRHHHSRYCDRLSVEALLLVYFRHKRGWEMLAFELSLVLHYLLHMQYSFCFDRNPHWMSPAACLYQCHLMCVVPVVCSYAVNVWYTHFCKY